MPTHKTDSDGAIKKIKKQDESSKLLKTKIKGQDESSKLLKKYYKKPKKDIMKEINEQEEKNKLLEKQKNEQDKILKQQNDEQKMETFFMNSKNSKTNEPNRFKYDLIDKLDLTNPNKNMALGNLSIYYTWKNVKSTYNNNKFKISASTWNETFDLPDGSYNISEIQDYVEYIIKRHETIGENAPILIYANTINNRIAFKIKSGYKLEVLSKETMKLLGSTKDIVDSDKNSENVPRLENVEVVLVHCNLVNNSYQQASRVLFTFVPTKQYGQLISISPHSLVFLKTMNTELMSFARNIGKKFGKKIFDKSLDVGKSMKKNMVKKN